MKERVKQSGASYSVKLKVIDGPARSRGKKYLVYEYNGELAVENISKGISDAIIGAKHYSKEWKEKTMPTAIKLAGEK